MDIVDNVHKLSLIFSRSDKLKILSFVCQNLTWWNNSQKEFLDLPPCMFPLCYQDILTFWKQLSKTAKASIFPAKSIVNGNQGDDVTARRAIILLCEDRRSSFSAGVPRDPLSSKWSTSAGGRSGQPNPLLFVWLGIKKTVFADFLRFYACKITWNTKNSICCLFKILCLQILIFFCMWKLWLLN